MPGVLYVRGNTLSFNNKEYRCAIGEGGFTENKTEGDKKTPLGIFVLRKCLYRADKIAAPVTELKTKKIEHDDGWCDDAEDANYNKPVKLPYAARHEILWRDDRIYDIIVPLSYNDAPVLPGKGSAIFLHIARPDYSPTLGCVAIALPDMLEILTAANAQSAIDIRP